MKLVKRIIAILLSIVLMAGTIPIFASAEGSDRAKDLVDVKLTEAQISALKYYAKHDSAEPVPVGFDLGTTLATWAINTALSYAFDGMMDGIFGGEQSLFPEIVKYLEEINAKLDKILEELTEMAKAIDVIQQTIDLQEKQSYMNEYIRLILQTDTPISGLWKTVKEIQNDMHKQTEKQPEVYRQEKLINLFLDQMGDSGNISSVNTHMDEIYRKFYSYTIAPYEITVNGKRTTADLFRIYGQYARLIFPWENEESLNALKNYADSVYGQYMIVAILESISLEARLRECDLQKVDCNLIKGQYEDLNENVSNISKAYLDCLEDIDEALNDNIARLWHPKYDIRFDKQLYQTEVPEENGHAPFKGVGFSFSHEIDIEGFWSKMNQPVDGSLPKNERACLSAETDAVYNVYDTLLGIKNRSFKQILTDGSVNLPATVEQVETPRIVLNVYDPEYPVSVKEKYINTHFVSVTGMELSKTASEHEYSLIETYDYKTDMMVGLPTEAIPIYKPNEYFVLAVKSVDPVDDAYKVNYKWAGEIPDGVTLPTDSTEYKWHDKPATDKTYTAGTTIETEDGVYTFSGWDASGDKDLNSDGLVEGNVTYRGYWTRSDIHIHTVDGKEIKFKPWTSDNSLPTKSGNYYLTKDVTLTNVWNVVDNTEINLCLNGHSIKQTADDKKCINVYSYATLNIHDCNGDNCTHEGYVDSDGLWHLGTGEGTAKSITGGVITGSANSGIYVYAYGHCNMYGGTIAGNKAKYGGGVYNDGVFNMYGGEICYNITSANSGGGIFANSSYTNMYGGTVSYNTAGYCGGGVHIADGKAFNMYNGTISNNNAEYGGGICVYSGTLNMSNGTVSNNTAPYGGGVYARSGNIVLGGSSVIDSNTDNNLYVKNGFLIDFGTGDNAPTKDMKVGVTLQYGAGTFTKECSDYSANFTSDNSALKVVYEDGVLKLATVVIPVPEISVSENDIVLNANGYTVDKLSLAYIGTEELVIDDWYTFENAGLQYKGINGSIGYKQYETPADGFTVPQHTTGYYAAYIRYIENGEKVVRYQVVYVDAAKSTPEIKTSRNSIVLESNGFTVEKLSLAYIGPEKKLINDWDSFEKAGLMYKDVNGSLGYKQYESPEEGKTIPQTTPGYYAAYIRFIENGQATVIYQVVYVNVEIALPEIQVSKNSIIFHTNDYAVEKLSLAYIGTEKLLINDWDSFANAGLKYTDINGSLGYKQYESPTDGKSYPQHTTGYYAAYIRYIDNGVQMVRYQVVYVDAEKSSIDPIVKPKKDDTPTEPTTPSSATTSESTNPANPDTGDTENIVLWIVAFAASSTVFAVCLIYGRKKKKAE